MTTPTFNDIPALLQRIAVALEAGASSAPAAAATAEVAKSDTPAVEGKKPGRKAAAEKQDAKPAEKAKPAHDRDQVQAALLELKDTHGMPYAKEILASFGIDKMANIKDEQFDDVFAAATAKLAELNAAGEEALGDDDI